MEMGQCILLDIEFLIVKHDKVNRGARGRNYGIASIPEVMEMAGLDFQGALAIGAAENVRHLR